MFYKVNADKEKDFVNISEHRRRLFIPVGGKPIVEV